MRTMIFSSSKIDVRQNDEPEEPQERRRGEARDAGAEHVPRR